MTERHRRRLARGLPAYSEVEIYSRKLRGQRQRDRRAARANQKREFILSLKQAGCTDCGYAAHMLPLQFDHLPGTVKVCGITEMVKYDKYTLDDLKAEVAKCELVCANCHMIRTHDRVILAAAEARANPGPKPASKAWETRPRGTELHNAKLDDEKVRRIRELRGSGLTNREVAQIIGCIPWTVSMVYNRKIWAHVDGGPLPPCNQSAPVGGVPLTGK